MRFLRHHWPVLAALGTGLSLSLIVAAWVYRWEQTHREERFDRQVNTLQVALQSYLDSSTQVARSLAAVQMIHGRLAPEELTDFANQVLRGIPVLAGLGFAPRVTTLEALTPDLETWQWGPEGQRSPVTPGQADDFFPTTDFLATGEEYPELGFDHGSDWRRRAAIAKARDTETLAATGEVPLTLATETGFILYVPVYQSAVTRASLDLEARQQAFVGVSYTILPSQRLLEQAIQETNSHTLDVYLYQLPVDYLDSALLKRHDSLLESLQDNLLVSYQDATLAKQVPQLVPRRPVCPFDQRQLACLRSLNWVDGEWSLLVLPRATWGDRPWRAMMTLGLGSLGTLAVTVYLNNNRRHRRQQAYLLKALLLSATQFKRQKEQAELALKQLMQAQVQLVHAEKMSGLGQLVAGIAHEINNPIGFIYGNISYASQYATDLLDLLDLYQQEFPVATPAIAQKADEIELDFLLDDFPKIINSMQMGAQRIQELVVSMRSFSRMDEIDMKPTDLHEGIDSTLTILRHRLRAKDRHPEIQVHRHYGELPLVDCAAGQVNQVFMNLLSNAVDALREHGSQGDPYIEVRTAKVGSEQIRIEIRDNGPGIPAEIASRIFEPFFTTKPVGKGTGLGLSISYQIVTEFHGGQLQCESLPEGGTCFTIVLPTHSQRSAKQLVKA